MKPSTERRKFVRHRVDWKVSLVPATEPNAERLQAKCLDLTIAGIAVVTSLPVAVGNRFVVYLMPPPAKGEEGRILRLVASVVYALPEEGANRVGLRFMENQSMERIQEAIRHKHPADLAGGNSSPAAVNAPAGAGAGEQKVPSRPAAADSQSSSATKPSAGTSQPVGSAAPSLLDRILEEAAQKLVDKEVMEFLKASLQREWYQQVDATLRPVFDALRNLAKSFDILNPKHAQGFSIPCVTQMDNLTWGGSRVDYRVRKAASEIEQYESLVFSYRWRGPTDRMRVVLKKEDSKIAERSLETCGIPCHVENVENSLGQQDAAISFPNELSCMIAVLPDDHANAFRLRLKNVGQAGTVDYEVPMDMLDKTTIDEVIRLMLGEKNTVATRLKRIDASTALN